jgi:hypothetical protein
MLSAAKFLRDKFGSSSYVLKLTSAYGFALPSLEAVDKWVERDSIPSGWFAVLLSVLELETGSPVSVLPYVRR